MKNCTGCYSYRVEDWIKNSNIIESETITTYDIHS